MKKIQFIFLAILLIMQTVCFADNTARIDELTKEAQELQQARQQYQQILNNIDIRLIEISGAIKELKKQDEPKGTDEKTTTNSIPAVHD